MSKMPVSTSSCFSGISDDILSKKNMKRVPSTTNATYSGAVNSMSNNAISSGGVGGGAGIKKNKGVPYPPAAVSNNNNIYNLINSND